MNSFFGNSNQGGFSNYNVGNSQWSGFGTQIVRCWRLEAISGNDPSVRKVLIANNKADYEQKLGQLCAELGFGNDVRRSTFKLGNDSEGVEVAYGRNGEGTVVVTPIAG